MALFDDVLSGGNWVTGLAIGVGALVILPLAAPILRPLAKTAMKGSILAYQGAAQLAEGISDRHRELAVKRGAGAVSHQGRGARCRQGPRPQRRGHGRAL
jgi:hypothetical protein